MVRPFHLAEFASNERSADAIKAQLALRDIHPARPDEIAAAREMAAQLIGPRIVQPDALRMVHEISGAGLFVTRSAETLTGALAVILLSPCGLDALQSERMDTLEPEPRFVTPAGAGPVAIYVWGMAATRKMAGARLSSGLLAMGDRATPHLPYYGRAASAAGLHLLRKTGFHPYPGSTSGLLRREPFIVGRAAA